MPMNESPDRGERNDLTELRAEMQRLRRDVDQLRVLNRDLVAELDSADPAERPHSRRSMLRLAGAAAVGTAAAGLSGGAVPAHATNDAMSAGSDHPADRKTSIRYGTGAKTLNSPPTPGTTNSFVAVDASALAGSVGVEAVGGQWGLLGQGGGVGVASYGTDYGFFGVASRKADFKFGMQSIPLAPKIAPPSRTDDHLMGELDADADGNLWFCIASGTPGTWQRLAGPGADDPVPPPPTPTGLLRPIGPFRVYDSRVALPIQGPLGVGQSRVISVADARDLTTGAVSTAGVVPVGATAISCNIGVVNTQNAGFLSINPGGDTEVRSASANWFGSGQVLNNGIIVKISGSREITAIVGGGGGTDLVVDVTGYFI